MPTEDEATIYREKVSESINVPAPDDLVQGSAVPCEIKISIGGKYQRGELMMSNGDNEFMTATASGLASTKEVCILCQDCEIPDGMTYFTAGYFAGRFNGARVVLSYETESDSHDDLIAEVKLSLRSRAIFLN